MNTDNSEAMRLVEACKHGWLENVDPDKCSLEDLLTLLRQQAERIAELEDERDRLLRAVAADTKMVFDLCAERDRLRAELALRPWRPISPARIAALWSEACKPERPTPVMVEAFVRLVEADHGIDHARTTHKDPA